MPKQSELMHYRLQAMLREHTFQNLEYLGVRPDSIGVDQHWYSIAGVEVPVDAIEELGNMEEVDESDTI
tara:strand:- start:927 stop:1133 length:207 start_codon:yes stop_codon:yes gene_type:complete